MKKYGEQRNEPYSQNVMAMRQRIQNIRGTLKGISVDLLMMYQEENNITDPFNDELFWELYNSERYVMLYVADSAVASWANTVGTQFYHFN